MKFLILVFVMTSLLLQADLPAQDESYVCKFLFASSNEITQMSTDLISLAVDAVWEASGITGAETFTGTLTQDAVNYEQWTYSPAPGDKLVIDFSNGSVVEFEFYSIDGYKDGTADDFKYSHLMDFNSYVKNKLNIRIYSYTYPQNGIIYWQRTIKGSGMFDSRETTVDINHNGNLDYDISSGYAYYLYKEQVTGTAGSGLFSVNVNEAYTKTIIHDSNKRIFASNTEITNNSSGNFNGINYRYQNAHVFWAAGTAFADSAYAGYYNNVIDAYQWIAEGSLIKNGMLYGNVQFDGPVLGNTSGPHLIVRLNGGNDILIHPLINASITEIAGAESTLTDFILKQNYPNPFNPSTVIGYTLPAGCNVTLKIYDILGREIAVLVNGYKSAGKYEIGFNGINLAAGIYFYRLTAGKFRAVRKMLLIK